MDDNEPVVLNQFKNDESQISANFSYAKGQKTSVHAISKPKTTQASDDTFDINDPKWRCCCNLVHIQTAVCGFALFDFLVGLILICGAAMAFNYGIGSAWIIGTVILGFSCIASTVSAIIGIRMASSNGFLAFLGIRLLMILYGFISAIIIAVLGIKRSQEEVAVFPNYPKITTTFNPHLPYIPSSASMFSFAAIIFVHSLFCMWFFVISLKVNKYICEKDKSKIYHDQSILHT